MSILILGGSHSEYPIIKAAKNLGRKVFTLGNIRYQNVDSIFHTFADYSDTEIVREFCIQNGIIRVISGCNDFAAISAAKVSEELGISHEMSLNIAAELHNKDIWNKSFEVLSISIPKTQVIDSDLMEINGLRSDWDMNQRLLVKPVDMTGGKGIFLTKRENLINDISLNVSNTRQRKLLVQEYIEGSLHSAFTVFDGTKTLTFFADEEIDDTYKVRLAVMPSTLETGIRTSVSSDVQKYIELLGLKQGLIHIQFILSKNVYKVIDVCARPPGDLFILLPLYAYKFNFSEYWIQPTKLCSVTLADESVGHTIRLVQYPWESMMKNYDSKILEEFTVRIEEKSSQQLQETQRIIFYRLDSVKEVNDFKIEYRAKMDFLSSNSAISE